MGTYLGYFGDRTIPEDRREEFTRRVLTILDQGGMMDFEEVQMFGRKLWLLTPPRLWPGRESITFCYNYFENEIWETGGYRPDTCCFYTNKVGWRQFDLVCSAVYVLHEFYADTFGMANRDDHVYDAREIIGWLNYLFGEHYTNSRTTDLWRIYQLLPEYRRNDNLLSLLPDDASMDVIGTLIYLAVTREDHEEEWKQLIAVPPHGPEEITPPDCIRITENTLKDLKASGNETNAQKLEQLKIVLKAGDQKVSPEIPKLCRFIGGISSMVPVEITAKLVADTFSLDFSTLLEELRPYARDVRELWNYKDRQPAEPIPTVGTTSFLGCSDDDRAWWWRPDGDVRFSDEMTAWLSGCRSELEVLAEQEPLLHGTEPLRLLMETLSWLIQSCPWYRPPSGISANCRNRSRISRSASGGIWQCWGICRCGRKCSDFRRNAAWRVMHSIKSSADFLFSTITLRFWMSNRTPLTSCSFSIR